MTEASDKSVLSSQLGNAGVELTVENVGSNGIDKVKLKGYPMDLFTPNLPGFRPSK